MEASVIEYSKKKANKWLSGGYDDKTKQAVKKMLDYNEEELVNSFYTDLEFGTGGLRGIMGVGTNRMNIYTIGMATQGLCNYLNAQFKDRDRISVAIAFDSRNNSSLFAENTAKILSANNINVFLFDKLRPTPELSFAIRHLKCQSGIVITASHNPKEYNGYKVYWEDGGQIIAPHDKNIIEEVRQIKSVDQVNFNANNDLIKIIGADVDQAYLAKVKSLSLSPQTVERNKDLSIVYTPIHGAGCDIVPKALQNFGFVNVHVVEKQINPDGDFPTVESPNPEEQAALKMAIEVAKSIDADIVMATDPDVDRVGIAIKNSDGEFVLLNGNQTAAILISYVLASWKNNNKLTGNEFIVKTIVTSELIADIAKKYDVACFNVLTGFKYIADAIKRFEGKKKFIAGGEESYGYLVGDFVRDKDAVVACAMIAEAAAVMRDKHKSLFDSLMDIYLEHKVYKELLVSLKKEGQKGAEEIKSMMKNYRDNTPLNICGIKVAKIEDYATGISKNMLTGETGTIDLPKSDVLQLFLEDDTKITMRPSGTEPKIKYYFSVSEQVDAFDQIERTNIDLDKKIENIKQELLQKK
jgi:phosphoglucomutase